MNFPSPKNETASETPGLYVFLALAAGPMLAWAQTTEQSVIELQAVQVQAERYPNKEENYAARTAAGVLRTDAPLFETAQSVSVVTHRQIEERQVKTVAEALEGVAGVFSGSYGRRGWDDFIIRGQISTAQTYVDGLRAQTSTNVLRSEDIFGIDSIEVIKGPTSVGFGQALPGGLVNLTTKRPQAETRHEAGFSYGSYAFREGSFDINHAPNGTAKGAFRIVGRVSDQNDPTDHVYFKNQYLASSYNFDLSGRNDLSVIASYQHRNYIRNQGISQNYQGYRREIFIGEPDRHYDVDVYRIGSNYAHYFDNNWAFKQNFAVTKGRSWSNSVFAAPNARFPSVARQINYQDKQDLNIALDNYMQRTFKFDRVDYELTVGLDMMRERSDYYSRIDNINPLDAGNVTYGVTSIREGRPSHNLTYNQYAGLYLRNTIKVDDRWIVGLSGRHDWTKVEVQDQLAGGITGNSDKAFTGNASVMYLVNDHIAPYVSYSTSFLPLTDTGANGSLLSPEEGKQTEVGVKFEAFRKRLQGYVAYYDLKRRNVSEYDATLGYSLPIGEQVTRGFEAEVAASLSGQWNVSSGYSYIPTAKTTRSLVASDIDQRINHVPKHAAGLFTQYYFSPGRAGWNMGAGIRFQGARTAQRGAYHVDLPKYTLFDANVGYEEKSWGAGLSIKNLFDKDYIQGTTPNAQLISFGSPRTIMLNAKIRF